MKCYRAFLLFVLIALLLVGGCRLWLRAQQQQYARNRQLIDALVKMDTKSAIALVNDGADPNTCYELMPAPTFRLLLDQLLHHSPPFANDSPTAFLVACGAGWNPAIHRPVMRVAPEENLALVQAMLAHGANVHARPIGNLTALHFAVVENRLHTVELLIQYGADVNAQSATGELPLMFAAYYDAPSIPRLLLAHGANPNAQDGMGRPALNYGIGATRNIPDLLAHGADPNLRDNNGQSPLQLAQQVGYSDAVRLLKRGAK